LKAAVYEGADDIQVKEVPEPEFGPTDVLVKPKYVGICGTDLSAWEYGMYEGGLIMGHEFTGEVVDVGEKVSKWKMGDRVVPNSLIPCGKCSFCTKSRHSLCEDMQMVGISMNGGLAELVALPEEVLHQLPDSVDYKTGIFVEPLSIVIRGFKRIDFEPGNSVLVLGTGPIGLLSIQLARVRRASAIYATEVKPARLEMAKMSGCDAAFNAMEESVSLRIESFTAGMGVDLVIECTGEPGPTADAFQLVKRGGTIVILGISEEPVEADFMTGVLNELKVQFSYLGYAEFPEAIELLSSKTIDPTPYITKVVPLERVVEEGFEALAHPDSNEVKVLVEI
jgi:(R,R)-butanediol dehydrogenase/meso-butanediol dehydrogenase/diacetyl reductase